MRQTGQRFQPDFHEVTNVAHIQANDNYRNAITTLRTDTETAFLPRMDSAKVSACKQKDNESVSEYLARLIDVFNTYSGLTQPADLGNITHLGGPPGRQLCEGSLH